VGFLVKNTHLAVVGQKEKRTLKFFSVNGLPITCFASRNAGGKKEKEQAAASQPTAKRSA
jgi:hypothetical protein